MRSLTIPLDREAILSLKVGDSVLLNGIIVTGRDAAHKWMTDVFIDRKKAPQGDDEQVYEQIKQHLKGGAIYHCGPVVSGLGTGNYGFVAAGPTTSTREEPYQGHVIRHFDVKVVIGKGGMGKETLKACAEIPAVYLHAVGGAASLIARTVRRVVGVYKLEFGVPEAMWVIEVKDFPAVVTMDSHGTSLHEEIEASSRTVLSSLIA